MNPSVWRYVYFSCRAVTHERTRFVWYLLFKYMWTNDKLVGVVFLVYALIYTTWKRNIFSSALARHFLTFFACHALNNNMLVRLTICSFWRSTTLRMNFFSYFARKSFVMKGQTSNFRVFPNTTINPNWCVGDFLKYHGHKYHLLWIAEATRSSFFVTQKKAFCIEHRSP